jgi:hypothetical protein
MIKATLSKLAMLGIVAVALAKAPHQTTEFLACVGAFVTGAYISKIGNWIGR